ncbi:MAG: GerMN domain-containing protein, partial [Microthrixaceae bacterium]
ARRVTRPRTILLLAATACLVVACGVPRDDVRTITSDELPAALRAPTTTAPSSPVAPPLSELADVAVFWISDKQLVPEAITFETAPDVERVITLLERGPDNTGRSSEVRSAVSQSGVIREVTRDEALVTVELTDAFSDAAGSDQVLALGQIVATLTSVPGVTEVEFLRGGEALEVPVPDGSLVRRPVFRSDYASLLSESASNR